MSEKRRSNSSFQSLAAAWASVLLTGSRVASALVVNKIIAIYLGPAGLAIVGQFQNFTAMAFGLTSGNISNAVISMVSGARHDIDRRRVISTAVILMAIGAGCVAVLIGTQASRLAEFILRDNSLAIVMQVLAVAMVPLVLNLVLLAALAGLGFSRAFVALNVVIALASMPVSWGLVRQYGTTGALLSAVIVNSCAFVMTASWIAWRKPFPLRWIWSGGSRATALRLLHLIAMTLSTILALPTSQYLVRERIMEVAGMEAAGQWQAALKTGEVLLMGAAVMVSLYLLPRFSRAGDELFRMALRACGMVIAGLAAAGALIVLGGEYVLTLLFTREFDAARQLLPFQVLGDVLRAGAVVLQAAFMAKLGSASYITVDLVYAGVLTASGFVLVSGRGAVGAVVAVVVASGCALCTATVLLQRLGNAGLRVSQ